jgi:hypothetical protein
MSCALKMKDPAPKGHFLHAGYALVDDPDARRPFAFALRPGDQGRSFLFAVDPPV